MQILAIDTLLIENKHIYRAFRPYEGDWYRLQYIELGKG